MNKKLSTLMNSKWFIDFLNDKPLNGSRPIFIKKAKRIIYNHYQLDNNEKILLNTILKNSRFWAFEYFENIVIFLLYIESKQRELTVDEQKFLIYSQLTNTDEVPVVDEDLEKIKQFNKIKEKRLFNIFERIEDYNDDIKLNDRDDDVILFNTKVKLKPFSTLFETKQSNLFFIYDDIFILDDEQKDDFNMLETLFEENNQILFDSLEWKFHLLRNYFMLKFAFTSDLFLLLMGVFIKEIANNTRHWYTASADKNRKEMKAFSDKLINYLITKNESKKLLFNEIFFNEESWTD